jgi:hypothetical protein
VQKCPTNSDAGFDRLLPTRWKGEKDEVGDVEDIIVTRGRD